MQISNQVLENLTGLNYNVLENLRPQKVYKQFPVDTEGARASV